MHRKFLFLIFSVCSFFVHAAPTTPSVSFQCTSAEEMQTFRQDLQALLGAHSLKTDITLQQHELRLDVHWINDRILATTDLKKDTRFQTMPIWHPALKETVDITSKAEIIAALLMPGRMRTLPCDLSRFMEEVGLRQNIVLWASRLAWVWPDGESAFWNSTFWDKGTPRSKALTYAALEDVFFHQKQYAIGCYTATKLVYVWATLDYYTRVAPNPTHVDAIMERLWRDQDPLVHVEPPDMWAFEADYDHSLTSIEGKLLVRVSDVKPSSLIPGDWHYLLNTDPPTYQKIGYEGSNGIYLGQNQFADYYEDHDHAYTFEEKLDEVYQWRHGVFSRSRDADKIQPLSNDARFQLKNTPHEGGLLLSDRMSPFFLSRP